MTTRPPKTQDIIDAYAGAHANLATWIEATYEERSKKSVRAKVCFTIVEYTPDQLDQIAPLLAIMPQRHDEAKKRALWAMIYEADRTLKLSDKDYAGLGLRQFQQIVDIRPRVQVVGYRWFKPKDRLWPEVIKRVDANHVTMNAVNRAKRMARNVSQPTP